jgi:hypothetical protein
METKEMIFQLSGADEQIVRTYECTYLKRWFTPPTIGYLTITNKRIVFHSSGKSLTGESLLINEMPLDDATGLSVHEGLSINWLLFLVFAALAYLTTQFIASALPRFFVSYEFAALLMLPFAIVWLLSSNILSDQVREQVLQTVDKLVQGRFQVSRDLRTYLPYTRIPMYIGLAILVWRIAFTSKIAFGGLIGSSVLLLAVYGFIFMNLFGRKHTFSLLIGSKTMKGSGIFIPGDTFRLFSARDTTALQAMGASPAADASQIARELGALLMDIQQLGDLGIQKWKK